MIGSTVLVITALTTIAQQLISDCILYGIDALASNQASGRFNPSEIYASSKSCNLEEDRNGVLAASE